MTEYVELLRQIFHTKAGERVLYEGDIHRMNWVPAVDPVRENVQRVHVKPQAEVFFCSL